MKKFILIGLILSQISLQAQEVESLDLEKERLENHYSRQSETSLWADFLFKSALLNGIDYSLAYERATGRNNLSDAQRRYVTIPSAVGLFWAVFQAGKFGININQLLTPDKLVSVSELQNSVIQAYKLRSEITHFEMALGKEISTLNDNFDSPVFGQQASNIDSQDVMNQTLERERIVSEALDRAPVIRSGVDINENVVSEELVEVKSISNSDRVTFTIDGNVADNNFSSNQVQQVDGANLRASNFQTFILDEKGRRGVEVKSSAPQVNGVNPQISDQPAFIVEEGNIIPEEAVETKPFANQVDDATPQTSDRVALTMDENVRELPDNKFFTDQVDGTNPQTSDRSTFAIDEEGRRGVGIKFSTNQPYSVNQPQTSFTVEEGNVISEEVVETKSFSDEVDSSKQTPRRQSFILDKDGNVISEEVVETKSISDQVDSSKQTVRRRFFTLDKGGNVISEEFEEIKSFSEKADSSKSNIIPLTQEEKTRLAQILENKKSEYRTLQGKITSQISIRSGFLKGNFHRLGRLIRAGGYIAIPLGMLATQFFIIGDAFFVSFNSTEEMMDTYDKVCLEVSIIAEVLDLEDSSDCTL